MSFSEQLGATRHELKIAAVAGGGLALGAAAAAVVLLAAAPAPESAPTTAQTTAQTTVQTTVQTTARVVLPALREAPDPTAVAAASPRVAVSAQASLRAARPARAGELDCLTQAVYYEARGEPASGQAAVAQVVMNRVRHPAFPKTVCEVVYQGAKTHGCQFSFACDGWTETPHELGAWRRAREIAARALVGVVAPQVAGATHFHTAGVAPGWGPNLLRVAQVGLHVFYRFGAPMTGASRLHAPESVNFARLNTADEGGEAQPANLQLAEASVVPTTAPAPAPAPAEPKPAPKAASADSKGVDAALRGSSTGDEAP
ncbi:cell wall hydrolase [Phenylobacterium sp.]|uniref:cell wall hydrolase n=1 Tax=Phenylobacterium sp. TaxID=1871053 RepID=UPI002F411E6D